MTQWSSTRSFVFFNVKQPSCRPKPVWLILQKCSSTFDLFMNYAVLILLGCKLESDNRKLVNIWLNISLFSCKNSKHTFKLLKHDDFLWFFVICDSKLNTLGVLPPCCTKWSKWRVLFKNICLFSGILLTKQSIKNQNKVFHILILKENILQNTWAWK